MKISSRWLVIQADKHIVGWSQIRGSGEEGEQQVLPQVALG
jgi:hypothetical protein